MPAAVAVTTTVLPLLSVKVKVLLIATASLSVTVNGIVAPDLYEPAAVVVLIEVTVGAT